MTSNFHLKRRQSIPARKIILSTDTQPIQTKESLGKDHGLKFSGTIMRIEFPSSLIFKSPRTRSFLGDGLNALFLLFMMGMADISVLTS